MCRRIEQRRTRERHSAIRPLVRRHWAQTAQWLPTSCPEIETRCSWTIQSLETRRCHSAFEIQSSSCAIRFRRTSQGCYRATRARRAFRRPCKRPVAAPVHEEVINPAHGRCRHLSKERLQLECCVANHGAVAIAACFRSAGSNRATR